MPAAFLSSVHTRETHLSYLTFFFEQEKWKETAAEKNVRGAAHTHTYERYLQKERKLQF